MQAGAPQHHHESPNALQTAGEDSKHRLLADRLDEAEALAAEAVTEGARGGGRKVRLELRTASSKARKGPADSAAVEHRASAVSLAETLSPPPAYETAISLPLPSSSTSLTPSTSPRRRCSHRHRSHRRDPSTSSTSSTLSDPTSDSEDPLNDLLRLTNSLLATSTSILASSTALQGSLARLLRSPPRGGGGFSARGNAPAATDDDEEAASDLEAASRDDEAEEGEGEEGDSSPAAQSVEQELRSELALSSFASDELARLDRDVERFDVRRRGRDPSSLFCGSKDARAERGRTVYVTAEAEGANVSPLGLGPTPAAQRRTPAGGAGGGMKRSPSAAAELLGKLASSPAPTSGMTRATSYAGSGLSAFLSGPPTSPSASPTPSSSKATLDAPFHDPSPSPSGGTDVPTRRAPAQRHRRASPLSPSLPSIPSTSSASTFLEPPSASPAPAAPLPTSQSSPRPALRRSPSSHDLRNPLPSAAPASLSTPSPLSSTFSTPTASSPVPELRTTPSHRRTHTHGNLSISLPRGSAALPTSVSFEDLDAGATGGASTAELASPRKAGGMDAAGSAARERLRALAGGEGAAKGGQGEEGKGAGSWWSWA
ncbi:hypothetical protein JCM6882_006978 [Rhodosporidiobolus microsporus]